MFTFVSEVADFVIMKFYKTGLIFFITRENLNSYIITSCMNFRQNQIIWFSL